MEKVNLSNLTPGELEELVLELGEKSFRAKQLTQWIFQKGARDFHEMTNLPNSLREKLLDKCSVGTLEIKTRMISKDEKTVKYLFMMGDGQGVESVLMRQAYGNSVCVSTQVGCKMGCKFCASTMDGWVRNLSSGEIFQQVMGIQMDVGERVDSIVIMGSGEPLDNYDNVLNFITLVNAPYSLNIGIRHITLSTSGLVPQIRALAEVNLPITLSISLHAPTNELRSSMMPINNKYPLEELIKACHDYIILTNRRITFEYALIKGFNDGSENANKLRDLLKGLLCHINLIPVNPVPELGWEKPDKEAVNLFKKELEKGKIEVTVRKEMGADIEAACGQLRRQVLLKGQKQG